GDTLAAIIVEPVAGNMGFVRPAPGFLEGLRELCTKCGALLIFDEVMTGFRVAFGGYQNTCNIRPDITCLGKVIGGGMPVAAYAAGVAGWTDRESGMLGLTFRKTPIRNFADAKGGDHARFAKFFHAMLDRGVWLPPSSYEAMFVSAAHTGEHVREIVSAARES